MRDDILPVYAASHDGQMHDPWFHPDQFWERLVELYAPGREFAVHPDQQRHGYGRLVHDGLRHPRPRAPA